MHVKNRTVLTVEDDRNLRRGISAFLKDIGFTVLEAENGRQGFEVFMRERPDLVLTDLKMPVMDGFMLISAIAQTDPDIPLVAISGTGAVNDAVEAIRRGHGTSSPSRLPIWRNWKPLPERCWSVPKNAGLGRTTFVALKAWSTSSPGNCRIWPGWTG